MNIVERVKNILLTPKTEWEVIEKETTSVQQLLLGYLLILALLPAIGNLIGYWLVGYRVPMVGMVGGSFGFAFRQGLMAFVSPFVSAFIAAFVINLLAESFGSVKDFRKAMQLVVYSFTPMLVAGILMIVPSLGFLASLVGLYGLYLLYIGLQPMMKTPDGRLTAYFVVSLLVMIVVTIVVGAILTGLFFGGGMAGHYGF